MNSDRRKEMNITRRKIKEVYEEFKAEYQLGNDFNGMNFLLDKRINEMGIRSLFIRKIYHYVNEQVIKEGLPISNLHPDIFEKYLPFVAEVIIAVQYYENQVLDGKGGLRDSNNNWNKQKIDRNLIAGHLIKDQLYEFIEDKITKKFPADFKNKDLIIKAVRRIFRFVDMGQAFQDEYGTLEAWKSIMNGYVSISAETDAYIDEKIINEFWKDIRQVPGICENEWFVRNYLKRMYLTTGSLFIELAKLVIDLMDYSGTERCNIKNFAVTHGILGQIVNDNNDIMLPKNGLSTVAKVPEDAFADLRNNNITLPLIAFLAAENGNVLKLEHLQKRLNAKENAVSIFLTKTINLIFPENIRSRIKMGLNKFESAYYTLAPSTIQTIQLTEQVASRLFDKQYLQNTPSGHMLYDMNSIAIIKYNKYSTLLTKHEQATSERKAKSERRNLSDSKSEFSFTYRELNKKRNKLLRV